MASGCASTIWTAGYLPSFRRTSALASISTNRREFGGRVIVVLPSVSAASRRAVHHFVAAPGGEVGIKSPVHAFRVNRAILGYLRFVGLGQAK